MIQKAELTKIFADEKKRFIILTDMENEPDDSQTMVKLLLYANEIDIEGLIAVTSNWLRNEVYPESIISRVQAYGIVRENLMKHAKGWPSTEELLAITAGGQPGYGMSVVGDGKSSEGSELIIRALLKDDPRPIYFSINAGANTLAQALLDMRERYDEATVKQAVSKIIVLDDAGQDDAGAWIAQEFPTLFYVRNSVQVFSLNGPQMNAGPQPWKPLNQFEWAERNVRRRHGILGELFPQRFMMISMVGTTLVFPYFMDGGGTTGVLHVLNNGLNVPSQITWGGWGGRFSGKKRKVFAYETEEANRLASTEAPEFSEPGIKRIDESAYEWNSMYPCARDTWYDSEDGILYKDNISAPLFRFRKDILFDFQARMDWCVEDFAHANHHPVACVNGDDGERAILAASVKSAETYEFDASASYDPDGNSLSYHWWIYPEAGTYQGTVGVEGDGEAAIRFCVPKDAKTGDTIHLVLSVRDDSDIVPLTSYRRIVLTVA